LLLFLVHLCCFRVQHSQRRWIKVFSNHTGWALLVCSGSEMGACVVEFKNLSPANEIRWSSTEFWHILLSWVYGDVVSFFFFKENISCILIRIRESCHKHFKPATILTSIFIQWNHTFGALRAGTQMASPGLFAKCLISIFFFFWFRMEYNES
jgi:hypothetical protein